MAASTILRVKRKIEDNPQDALVLMCKRIKTDTEEISPSLFVFRGTVNNKEISEVRDVVPNTDIKFKKKHSVGDLIDKIRKEKKQDAQKARYEVVKCSRGLKDIVQSCDKVIDLVDLQKPDDEETDVQYAYDLYIAAKQDDFDITMLDNLVSIENYESNLIFGSYRDNGLNSPSDDEPDDEDDSNDENNWRNEYPDTEDSSIDEEDMINAMKKCDIDDDLSSDTGEDKIYDDVIDPFNEDVKRYGAAYAKYKAKVLSEEEEPSRDLVHCTRVKDIDEESIEGYKSDSNDGFYYGEEEDTEQFREQYDNMSPDEYSPD